MAAYANIIVFPAILSMHTYNGIHLQMTSTVINFNNFEQLEKVIHLRVQVIRNIFYDYSICLICEKNGGH
jgi:hypothetical protein